MLSNGCGGVGKGSVGHSQSARLHEIVEPALQVINQGLVEGWVRFNHFERALRVLQHMRLR